MDAERWRGSVSTRAVRFHPTLGDLPELRDVRCHGSLEATRAIYAFRLVATRTPKSGEVERVLASYQRQLEKFRNDRAAAARTIKGYEIANVDAAEQAAWTLVANALLNLDEALSKE